MPEFYSPPRAELQKTEGWDARDRINLAVLLCGVVPAVAFPLAAILGGVIEELYGREWVTESHGIVIAFSSMLSSALGTAVASVSLLRAWGQVRRLRLASFISNGLILLVWLGFAAWALTTEFSD